MQVGLQSNAEDILFLKLIDHIEVSCRNRICDPRWCESYTNCHAIIDRGVAYKSSMKRFDKLAYVEAFNKLCDAGIIRPNLISEYEKQCHR